MAVPRTCRKQSIFDDSDSDDEVAEESARCTRDSADAKIKNFEEASNDISSNKKVRISSECLSGGSNSHQINLNTSIKSTIESEHSYVNEALPETTLLKSTRKLRLKKPINDLSERSADNAKCKKSTGKSNVIKPSSKKNELENTSHQTSSKNIDLSEDNAPTQSASSYNSFSTTVSPSHHSNLLISNESKKDLSAPAPEAEPVIRLTAAQRARIEQNRQRALLIKQEKMNRKLPPLKKSEQLEKEGKKVIRINDTKLVDSGAGFFIEEEDDFSNVSEAEIIAALRRAEEPAPLLPEDRPTCQDCGNTFDSSYLYKKFDHPTCDDCRDNESKHALITKTDARNEYQLKDVDFDARQPPLRFIVRKNPHNERWGDMKLYLKLQVEKRCLEVWGSEEALEDAITKKHEQREISKQKKFKKKMQELRMNVRSSLYTRASKSHEHEYGEEEYIEEDDEYSRTCSTCGHSYRYDKM